MLLNKRAHIHSAGNGAEQNFAESKPCTLDISDNTCSVIYRRKNEHCAYVHYTDYAQRTTCRHYRRIPERSVQQGEKYIHVAYMRKRYDPRSQNIILSAMFGLISNDGELPVWAVIPEDDSGSPGRMRRIA
jgi:hypothetical protein